MIIGLDVGGTHTDIVLLDKFNLLKSAKIPTNTNNIFQTVLDGLEKIIEGVDAAKIEKINLSTTLTTNAIVQNKTPEAAIICTGGPGIDMELLKPCKHFFIAKGAIDHQGNEIVKIDEEEIRKIGEEIKAKNINYVGIVGKFSVRNPKHELLIEKILKENFEEFFLGHKISGNLNFPRRIATVYLHAISYPLHKEFFKATFSSLEKKQIKIPIHILKADGGTIEFKNSLAFPAESILSGPAASVMGASIHAKENIDLITIDIGGTTSDISAIINKYPVLEPFGISFCEYKTLIRSLKSTSVGLGGDSLVRFEKSKLIIGPERLGPAIVYGGNALTVTDAIFFAKQKENASLAKDAIFEIAEKMGLKPHDAATKIFDEACKIILNEVSDLIASINQKGVYTVSEVLDKYQFNPKNILILGGPAKDFAEKLNQNSKFDVDVVKNYKVANAIGAALARTTCEISLLADTTKKLLIIPEEGYLEDIASSFDKKDALDKLYFFLEKKVLKMGSNKENLEMEIIEDQEFNIIKGFDRGGKSYRLKGQVKPGIDNYFKESTLLNQ